jgi:hypothetical protein
MTLVGNRVLKLGTLLLAGTGLVAFGMLIKLRFDAGDSMPHGSSLRSDPLGIEVLVESLNSSGLVTAERNYFELKRAKLDEVDMLVFSCDSPPFRGSRAEAIQSFVTNQGGRVLFTLPPQAAIKEPSEYMKAAAEKRKRLKEEADKKEADKKKKEAKEKSDKNDDDTDDEDDPDCKECGSCNHANMTNVLWQTFSICNLPEDKKVATLNPAYDARGYTLPATLPLKTGSGLSTNMLQHGWQAVYSCGDVPVVVEHRADKGSVVVSALSYPFSNEAMRSNRETGFLLWVFGNSKKILVDESHFGLVFNRTVAKLIRKNNLHYALLALLLPCLLFFWLTGMPLIPRYTRIFDTDADPRNSSGSALSKLLKRSIPPKELVPLALEAWIKANPIKVGTLTPEARKELEGLVALNRERARKLPRATHITAAYNDVVAFIKQHEL